MNRLHRLFAVGLVFSIGVLPIGEGAAIAASASPPPDQVKQQINQYGLGANLSVRREYRQGWNLS